MVRNVGIGRARQQHTLALPQRHVPLVVIVKDN